MTASRVVSLIGLPGAGKTTLGKTLVRRLGPTWTFLGTGEALRVRGRADSSLREQLNGGQMGPESLVHSLVTEAVQKCPSNGGLILDGFPRHAQQVDYATEHFERWMVLYIDVESTRAVTRLQSRQLCEDCGATLNGIALLSCSNCGSLNLTRRTEDVGEVLQQRFHKARTQTDALIHAINKDIVLKVNANFRRRTVEYNVVRIFRDALLTT